MEVLDNKKILVIQTAFLGDAILTLPMLQKLKEKIPNAHITVLCIPSTKEVFKCSTAIDHVMEYDKRGAQKSMSSFFKLISYLRRQKFSIIYSPHRSLRSTLLSYFSHAELIIGFDISAASFLYDRTETYVKGIHEVARNLKLIGESIENEKWKILPEINISDSTTLKVNNILREINHEKIIAVAPGSVWETKKYPKEYFEKIIKYLIDEKYFVVLIGGKADASLCNEIEIKFKENIKSFSGELTVIESIELLKNVRLLLSNDSAPTHMAMAANIPVLTIYCSTVASFGFYPYNQKSEYISYDDLKCKPCGIHGYERCPVKTFDCGLKLVPEVVIRKVLEMLAS